MPLPLTRALPALALAALAVGVPAAPVGALVGARARSSPGSWPPAAWSAAASKLTMAVLAPKRTPGLALAKVHVTCGPAYKQEVSAAYRSRSGASLQLLEGHPHWCGNIGLERLVRHIVVEGHRADLLACGVPGCPHAPDALVWREDGDELQVLWMHYAASKAIRLARSLAIVPRASGRATRQPATARAGAPPKLPTQLLRNRGLEARPPVISFTGDGTGYLGGFTEQSSVGVRQRGRGGEGVPWAGHLNWSSWSSTRASASGAIWLNDGMPDDARGTFHPYPVTVHVDRPRGGVFTRLSFRFRYRGRRETEERVAVHRHTSVAFSGWEWDIAPRGPRARARGIAHSSRSPAPLERMVIREDEARIAALYGDCRAFAGPSGCGALFKVARTGDGNGGVVYGLLLSATAGGGCRGGAVYFFHGRQLVATTEQRRTVNVGAPRLPPHPRYGTEVRSVGVPHARRFAVSYLVDRTTLTPCAASGDGGRDAYQYEWTGKALTVLSGRPPRPPAVFAP